MTVRALCMVIGYVFGLFQTAYIYGKARGVDIRKKGSGNAGTTNALRVFGTGTAFLVFAGDCLKCILAIFLAKALFAGGNPDIWPLLRAYTALGCILGHNFPFYMGFRGGKGIACTAGYAFSFSLSLSLIGLAAFFLPLALTHYVSIGSLLLNVVLIVWTVVTGEVGRFGMARGPLSEMYAVTVIIAALAFWQHRGNIARLLAGKERKTYLSKKNKLEEPAD